MPFSFPGVVTGLHIGGHGMPKSECRRQVGNEAETRVCYKSMNISRDLALIVSCKLTNYRLDFNAELLSEASEAMHLLCKWSLVIMKC